MKASMAIGRSLSGWIKIWEIWPPWRGTFLKPKRGSLYITSSPNTMPSLKYEFGGAEYHSENVLGLQALS